MRLRIVQAAGAAVLAAVGLMAGVAVWAGGGAQTNQAIDRGNLRPAGNAVVTDAELARIVRELGDADFNVRERAQKALEAVPWSEMERLKAAVSAGGSQEMNVRVAARLEEMEIDSTLYVPPISLEIKDATPIQAAAALGRVVNVPIEAVNWGNGIGVPNSTLKVANVPFWDVLKELSSQGGGWLVVRDGGLKWMRMGGWEVKQVRGGLCVGLEGPYENTPPNMIAEAGAGAIYFRMSVAVDPRIHVAALELPVLRVVSETGVEIWSGSLQEREQMKWPLGNLREERVIAEKPAEAAKVVTVIAKVRVVVEDERGKREILVPVEFSKVAVKKSGER